MRTVFATILFIVFSSAGIAQNKVYSVVFLNRKNDAEQLPKEKVDSLMKGHMQNMERLAAEGKLLAAGPFHGGGGIFIMNTTSVEEVKTWISTDPGIKAKRWDIEILPYRPRVGGICPVKEPYEMTNYSFVRFDAIVSKATAQTSTDIIRRHDEFLKKLSAGGTVVTEAIFSDRDGGIIVIRGDVDEKIFDGDPGVQEGLMQYELKKLYIAKGSFCEQ